MNVAISDHAVLRYRERVEGSGVFDDVSIRRIIRGLVEEGFKSGAVRPHPTERERKIIPFSSGKSVLYLSLGPNKTGFKADLAVIGVLYERNVTGGKAGMGVTLGDAVPSLYGVTVRGENIVLVVIDDGGGVPERYRLKGAEEAVRFLKKRNPKRKDVEVFKLLDLSEFEW